MPGDDGTISEPVGRVNAWMLTRLPYVNQDILARRRPPGDLSVELARSVLADLPRPETLTVLQAQQLVVLLGLAGASMARHYQEQSPAHRATPERAFDQCTAGDEAVPFRAYFGRLAERTGAGHCHRDSYAALTRWNLPTVEIWWADERIAVLAGVFDDGLVRTYTGTAEEQRFFELIKVSEALEGAVNAALMPLSDATLDVRDPEAPDRIRLAVTLMAELRRVNAHFSALSPAEGLRAEYFMDVFRQYAVHWTPSDIPPSGALDPQALARDCLLGVQTPAYQAHTEQIFPALLATERELLTRLMERPPLPRIALRSLGIGEAELAEMPPPRLRETVSRHPVLAILYVLLVAHARMSGVHLKIAQKYLFAPQRKREMAGLGDPHVVSNRSGTTGMDERYLQQLTRARQQHPLACLRTLGGADLEALAGLDRVRAAGVDLGSLVRFTGSGARPVPWLVSAAEAPALRNVRAGGVAAVDG
jgi:hypothetical protein